jgi:hypothetical protein
VVFGNERVEEVTCCAGFGGTGEEEDFNADAGCVVDFEDETHFWQLLGWW